MDPISEVLYRHFTITNCNALYPNALEVQNGSLITYGQQLELVDKPDEMHNQRNNVSWSITASVEGPFNDDRLELSKTTQRLSHWRKTIIREGFSWTRGLI